MAFPRARALPWRRPASAPRCRLVLIDRDGIAIYVADIHYIKDCFALRSDLLSARKARGLVKEQPRKSKASPRAHGEIGR
jgi:hypothetical protein